VYFRPAGICLVINWFGCTRVPITVAVSGRDSFTRLLTVGHWVSVVYIRRAAFCLVINGFGCTGVTINGTVLGRDRFTMLFTVGH